MNSRRPGPVWKIEDIGAFRRNREHVGAASGRAHARLVPQALLQGVPPPAGGGIKYNFVISGGMYVGNDTSHEIFADHVGYPENHENVFLGEEEP